MSALDEIAAGALVLPHLRLTLMRADEIVAASGGRVLKPETVNYANFIPEKSGLFCQEIFGEILPCPCGREPKLETRKRDMKAGRLCSACRNKAPLAPSRRRRFGHIALAAPVVHPWFAPWLARTLGMEREAFERVMFLESYLVTSDAIPGHPRGSTLSEEALYTLLEQGLPADSMANGAEALERMMGGAHPALMRVIPVLPPHLRPLVPLSGGRVATSDVNDLYRRVINRNNRLARLIELNAPEIIIRNEKRMLQEAVNALFDNERCHKGVVGPNRRLLHSIAARTGNPDRLDELLSEIDAEIGAGRASLERPRRQHRRLAALRGAGLAIGPPVQ